jgi:CNT family concentrative nucleoside transporter
MSPAGRNPRLALPVCALALVLSEAPARAVDTAPPGPGEAASTATVPAGTDGAPAQKRAIFAQGLRHHETLPVDRVRSAFGLAAILALCLLLSRDRRRIDWRLVAIGLGLQALLALGLLLRLDDGTGRKSRGVFDVLNDGVVALLSFGQLGADFLFTSQVTGHVEPALRNFAFGVLPSIVFFSALMACLYHLGIMQLVIRALSWLMQKTMRTSGAETLSTAANIFVGQTEAPLLVRPFLAAMTRSELLVVMAGGMANTAGGVLAAYVGMLKDVFPDIAGHLVIESILSAPAALVTAKMIMPELGVPVTSGVTRIDIPRVDRNSIEAAARGASEGLALAFNVAAMLIAFIALVSLLDAGLAALTGGVTFQSLAGWAFSPFAWLMGVPPEDCLAVGRLLGQKLVLNEFVAYGTLSELLAANPAALSDRSLLITSYALSGFANFGSIGILIGGMGALAPERRGEIAALGLWAVVAGSLATFMTACFAGLLR